MIQFMRFNNANEFDIIVHVVESYRVLINRSNEIAVGVS